MSEKHKKGPREGGSLGRLNKEEKKWILEKLEGQDELRWEIAKLLTDQGMNTYVNKSWPEVLEILRQFLIYQLNASRNFCKERNMVILKDNSDILEVLTVCHQLLGNLEHMARSGELFSEGIISPLKELVRLGHYWRNRLMRGLGNKDPKKNYDVLSEESRAEAHARFQEMTGLPYKTLNELSEKLSEKIQ